MAFLQVGPKHVGLRSMRRSSRLPGRSSKSGGDQCERMPARLPDGRLAEAYLFSGVGLLNARKTMDGRPREHRILVDVRFRRAPGQFFDGFPQHSECLSGLRHHLGVLGRIWQRRAEHNW